MEAIYCETYPLLPKRLSFPDLIPRKFHCDHFYQNDNDLNKKLTIEGILMSMYDVRLRLSNQVVEEVQTHFKNLVFNTIIPRNVKLSEAPSFGIPVISYDASCKGSISYLNLAKEVVDKNGTVKVEW